MPWIIVPELAYALEGMRIVDQLKAEGLDVDLTPEQVRELARASIGPPKRWVDRVPELTPEGRAALDRLAAQNREQARASIDAYNRRRERCRGHRHAANETCPDDQDQGRSPADQRPTPEHDQIQVEGEGRPARVDQLQDQVKALDHDLDQVPEGEGTGDPGQLQDPVPNPAQTAPDDAPLNSPKIREMGKPDINRRGADQHSVTRRSRNEAGQTS